MPQTNTDNPAYIHSLSTLLGTPVHLHTHAIISLANCVAAVQCIKLCRYWLPALMFSSTSRMEFTQNGAIKKKHPVSVSSVDGNALLIRKVTEEWPE